MQTYAQRLYALATLHLVNARTRDALNAKMRALRYVPSLLVRDRREYAPETAGTTRIKGEERLSEATGYVQEDTSEKWNRVYALNYCCKVVKSARNGEYVSRHDPDVLDMSQDAFILFWERRNGTYVYRAGKKRGKFAPRLSQKSALKCIAKHYFRRERIASEKRAARSERIIPFDFIIDYTSDEQTRTILRMLASGMSGNEVAKSIGVSAKYVSRLLVATRDAAKRDGWDETVPTQKQLHLSACAYRPETSFARPSGEKPYSSHVPPMPDTRKPDTLGELYYTVQADTSDWSVSDGMGI